MVPCPESVPRGSDCRNYSMCMATGGPSYTNLHEAATNSGMEISGAFGRHQNFSGSEDGDWDMAKLKNNCISTRTVGE